jgi:hypothetical protein
MRKMAIIHKLGEYFTKKGKILNIPEYNSEEDKPMRALIIKRVFNSWSRMEIFVKKYYPDIGKVVEKPKPVKSVKKVEDKNDE